VFLGVVTAGIGIARLTNSRMPRFSSSSTIWTGAGMAWLAIANLVSMHHLVQSANRVLGNSGSASIGAGL